MVWQIGGKIGWKIRQQERRIRRWYAILKNLMESDGISHVRHDRMNRIRLSIYIRKMHYGMNIKKIAFNRSGSGNKNLDGIWATPMPSNSLKSGNGTSAIKQARSHCWITSLQFLSDWNWCTQSNFLSQIKYWIKGLIFYGIKLLCTQSDFHFDFSSNIN